MTTLVHGPGPNEAVGPTAARPEHGAAARRRARADLRPLSEMVAGEAGVIVGVRLTRGSRLTSDSPLRPGSRVQVLESVVPSTRHVRIGFREYSVPAVIGRHVFVDCSEERPPTAEGLANASYEVVLNRINRGVFKLLIVRRDTGMVVHGEIVEGSKRAKEAREALRREAASMTAAEFREKHRLP